MKRRHALGALCLLGLWLTGCGQREPETVNVTADPLAAGQQIYLRNCASCHLADGHGLSGDYPPLAGSAWVTGAPNRLAALLVDGMRGPQQVGGARYDGIMPAWRGVLTAPELAVVLTYIRQAWGNHASPIPVYYVHKITDQYESRRAFWSPAELQAIPPEPEPKAGGS